MRFPVVQGVANMLVHAPSLVRYGSKPFRELAAGSVTAAELNAGLMGFKEAVAYPPNQVFIGNLKPDSLARVPQPWFEHPVEGASRFGPYGECMDEAEFYGFTRVCDEFDLFLLEKGFASEVRERLQGHALTAEGDLKRLGQGLPLSDIEKRVENGEALPLYLGERMVGCVQRAHDQDESLSAHVLMENLVCKASGVLALRQLLRGGNYAPEALDYIIAFSEEAVGDRYNRGGGNMAKAIGEMVGCDNATGSDVKAFCSAPIHAIVVAASLVASGIFREVAVVGGASLPKLGMKFQSHLAKGMPILEDMLGAVAILIGPDDGHNPVIRTDLFGKHDISSGSSQQAIMEALVVKPLERAGKNITDIAKYATELHNPEITVPADRGDVPKTNYRMIGALAVKRGEIKREALDEFVAAHGMPGFSPTQGHIPAAVPFLSHARDLILTGEMENAMFVAKGSLFLGRMTNLSDGMSFILERNKEVAMRKYVEECKRSYVRGREVQYVECVFSGARNNARNKKLVERATKALLDLSKKRGQDAFIPIQDLRAQAGFVGEEYEKGSGLWPWLSHHADVVEKAEGRRAYRIKKEFYSAFEQLFG